MRKTIIAYFLLFLVITCQNVFSAEAIEGEFEDPMGAIVTFMPDGSIKSIKATGEAPLRFGDRTDIISAKKKAELRAKAALAKFLKERLNTKESIDDMTKVASEMTAGASEESAVRKTLEQQTEVIENSADALLKGVIVLYEDVNKTEKYVKMQWGFNYKTMKAADTAKQDLERNLADPVGQVDDSAGNSGESNSGGREIRKSKMYNEF